MKRIIPALLLAVSSLAQEQIVTPERTYENVRVQNVYTNEVVFSFTDAKMVRQVMNLPLSQVPTNFVKAFYDRQAKRAASKEEVLDIASASGTVYKSAQILRGDEGHIVISYRPESGGLGMVTLDMLDLSSEWQQRLGYNHQKRLVAEARREQEARELQEQYGKELIAQIAAQRQAWNDSLTARSVAAQETSATAALISALNTNQTSIKVVNQNVNQSIQQQIQQKNLFLP